MVFRFDLIKEKWYESIDNKRVYLSEEYAKLRIRRKVSWSMIDYRKRKYIKITWKIDLDAVKPYGYTCSCGSRHTYVTNMPSGVFVSCGICLKTMLLAFKKFEKYETEFEGSPENYTVGYEEKEISFAEACLFWAKGDAENRPKGFEGRGMCPPTEAMQRQLGFMP